MTAADITSSTNAHLKDSRLMSRISSLQALETSQQLNSRIITVFSVSDSLVIGSSLPDI